MWRQDLLEGRTRPRKENPSFADPFDPEQDIMDEVALQKPSSAEDLLLERSPIILMNCNLGDGNRLLLYIVEMFEGVSAILEEEEMIGVKCVSEEVRASTLLKMFNDALLTKKVDRFYCVEGFMNWSVDWPLRIYDSLSLGVDCDKHVYRMSCAPRKMEQECVTQLDDILPRQQRPLPRFDPRVFSHAICCVELCPVSNINNNNNNNNNNRQRIIAFGKISSNLLYLKASERRVDVDTKISRAYWKLWEALRRFHLKVSPDDKAIDVGASPGGWTQCMVESGARVWSIDPASPGPLPESVLSRVVWIKALSDSDEAISVLQKSSSSSSSPDFDWIVCDMNILPDELARSFGRLLPFLKKGGHFVVTIKLSHLRPEQRMVRRFSKGSGRFVKYFAEHHPEMKPLGIKWLLQNKNERCMVFRKE